MERCIAIGGFMGVGKTTVGRLVADMLQVSFCDLDDLVEDSMGQSVAELFERCGETVFRDAEAKALRRAMNGSPKVIALGGGTLHHHENCTYIQSRAALFCLSLPFDLLVERLGEVDAGRPLWGASAKHLYEQRQPLFSSAGVLIDATDMNAKQVAERIVGTVLCS